MQVQTLTPEVAKKLEIKADHGVVVTDVQSGSPAERAGLAPGMVIVEANRKPVKTPDDLNQALDEKSAGQGRPAAGPHRRGQPLRCDSRMSAAADAGGRPQHHISPKRKRGRNMADRGSSARPRLRFGLVYMSVKMGP